MKRRNLLLLEDILDANEKIASYTDEMSFGDFMSDDRTMDAVIRNFTIIGQAARIIPKEFQSKHLEIEWGKIIGFRNFIVHDYFQINYEIVWKIKQNNLPELVSGIEALVNYMYSQPEE